jgi:bacteriorhodopsin
MMARMSEPNEIPPKRNYKWPWFVAAAVLLFLALAVLWVSFAANREKQERDFNVPIPTGGK